MLELILLAAPVVTAVLGFELLYRVRDRRSIVVQGQKHAGWLEGPGSEGHRRFTTRIPVVNTNAVYEQTLVDVRADIRVLTRGAEVSGQVKVRCVGGFEREDGYWQAQLLGPGEAIACELDVTLSGPDRELARLHAAVVQISYTTYGRRDLQVVSEEVVLPLASVGTLPPARTGRRYSVQCVPTPILTAADDIVEVIATHTASFRQAGDIVAVAESVVAITQGQYFCPKRVRPGFWAKRLCYFVPSKGSLSSPHGFQVAIGQVGLFRMLSAFFLGALFKLVGVKGVFYSLAGRPAELIDDVTGTMPPFDKYIVAGPVDASRVVEQIRKRTGMEAAIVDANDLKRVMVLAHTDGITAPELSEILIDNPFGNGDEQTPIVVLRALGAADKGDATRDPIGTTG